MTPTLHLPAGSRSNRQQTGEKVALCLHANDWHFSDLTASSNVRFARRSLARSPFFDPIELNKSLLLADERIFLSPLMRVARGNVMDHIVSHKNDHGPTYRPYRALQRDV